MHRSGKFWEAPKEFRPERWLGSDAASSSSLMSFSAGPRVCIGKNFAMMEMKIVLATLLLNFTWTLPEDYEFIIQSFTITLTPKNGMPVQFTRR
jgi:cytochrome P450